MPFGELIHDLPAVEQRNRQQVENAEADADRGEKAQEVRETALGALPAMSAIASGPDMFFSDTSPTTMCAIIDTVNVIISQVFCTPRGSDSRIP